jgi:hypothetical protein
MEHELHLIEEDLDGHNWYLDLVSDFVEDVLAFAAQQLELDDR